MPSTTNHNVLLPTVGASADTWGGENNDAHQAWDTLTSGAQNTFLGRVAAGSGPMTQLTGAQVAGGLPQAALGVRGVVKASASGTDANRPLTGDGNFKKGIGRFAGGRCVFSGNQVLGGINIASAVWTNTGAAGYRLAVTFSSAAANANYQVLANPERAAPGSSTETADCPVVVAGSQTVNGFTLAFIYSHVAMHLTVFEG